MVPFSVLDLSPVTSGHPAAQALRNSIDLAVHADRLGFTRYWLAEHHNLPSVASGAPDIMAGQIAAATRRIRVGAGGVMLPNHAPLQVAERFKLLAALFPERIDLGLGRAPGTDQVTSYALRRRQNISEDDDFLERFQELLAFENGGFPADHPFRSIHPMPVGVPLPPIYLLGSSGYSAQLSAAVGLGFSFAHHFASHDAVAAMTSYRELFKPSATRDAPHAILGVHVVCGDDDATAQRLASTVDLNFVRRARGEYLPLSSPQEAEAYPYAPIDQRYIQDGRRRVFVGSPATIRAKLTPLIEATKADEVMVTSMIYDHAARKRSYELLAREFGVTSAQPSRVATPVAIDPAAA